MGMTPRPATVRAMSYETSGKEKSKSFKKSSNANTSPPKSILLTLFVSLVLDLVAFTMILPLLPSILDQYHQSDSSGLYRYLSNFVQGFQAAVGVPERFNMVLFGGFLGSLFSALQFMASPLIGSLSDVYGRKPMMLLSMAGVAISYLIWFLSHNFALFVVSRIVGGICKGNISISTAVVADACPPERRGKGMAAIGIAFSVGFILGPIIGATFAHWNRSGSSVSPALCALVLQVVDIIFVALFFPETLPKEKRARSMFTTLVSAFDYINPSALFGFKAVRNLSKKHMAILCRLGFINFLFLLIFSGLEFTLTFLVHIRYGYTSMQQGRMFFFIGLVMILTQGGYSRRMEPGKEKRMAMQGLVSILPAFAIIALIAEEIVFYGGLLLFSFASATIVPSLSTIVCGYGAHDQKGTVLGIFRSLGALARAIGPVIASFAFWSIGAEMTYLMGSLTMLVPLYLIHRYKDEDGVAMKHGKAH